MLPRDSTALYIRGTINTVQVSGPPKLQKESVPDRNLRIRQIDPLVLETAPPYTTSGYKNKPDPYTLGDGYSAWLMCDTCLDELPSRRSHTFLNTTIPVQHHKPTNSSQIPKTGREPFVDVAQPRLSSQ